MGFNYGYEVKKLTKKWETLRLEYKDAGMSDEDIRIMWEYDWDWLKSERRYHSHGISITGTGFADGDIAGEDQSSLLGSYLEQLAVRQPEISTWGRYDWIEDLDTPELARYIKLLPEKNRELLACMVADNMKQADLSREMGVSRNAVSKSVKPMKENIKNIFPGRFTKERSQ